MTGIHVLHWSAIYVASPISIDQLIGALKTSLSHPLSCAGDRFHCPDQRFGFRGNEGRASAARPRARNSLAVSACGGGFAGFTSAPAGTAPAFFASNLASCLVAMSF